MLNGTGAMLLLQKGVQPGPLPDRLRDERLRQVDTVLEDVRRRNAVTNEIHRGGAGARRQGVRQLSRDTLVQQC